MGRLIIIIMQDKGQRDPRLIYPDFQQQPQVVYQQVPVGQQPQQQPYRPVYQPAAVNDSLASYRPSEIVETTES